MPGLLQLRANLAADISHVVSFREVKLDFELYYIVMSQSSGTIVVFAITIDVIYEEMGDKEEGLKDKQICVGQQR